MLTAVHLLFFNNSLIQKQDFHCHTIRKFGKRVSNWLLLMLFELKKTH
jgi:hypothetical protein